MLHTTTKTPKVRRTKSETDVMVREAMRRMKVDQEPDEVAKGRVIEREEVWKSSCD